MLVKLAWRNMFRNKRRTFIAGTAIGVGLAALIFSDALIIGMKENMIHTATASFMGEGQIHAEGFRETRDVKDTIHNADSILSLLRDDPQIGRFAPRVMTSAMVSSPASMSSIVLWGIDPEREKHLSQIDEALTKGEYVGDSSGRGLVVGSELAELLQVEEGERIVVTVSRPDGGLSQELFRVGGIYHFNSPELDQGMAFANIVKVRSMLGMTGGSLHEISFTVKDDRIAGDTSHVFWDRYNFGDNRAVGWTELIPQFAALLDMTDLSMWLLGFVLFGVVSLGIVNTLFMSLYDRMFEFGVLRAVGTRPRNVWSLIFLEAGALAVISSALGIILGFALTLLFNRVGIDYRGIEFSGVTIQQLIYPQLQLSQFILYPVAVIGLTLVVGMYPATYAAKLRPADAMRRSF